jgi:hypothetical protein
MTHGTEGEGEGERGEGEGDGGGWEVGYTANLGQFLLVSLSYKTRFMSNLNLISPVSCTFR